MHPKVLMDKECVDIDVQIYVNTEKDYQCNLVYSKCQHSRCSFIGHQLNRLHTSIWEMTTLPF